MRPRHRRPATWRSCRRTGVAMRFRLLGPVGVEIDGGAVTVARPRQLAVLAYLLLNRNTLVPLEQLVKALWDGDAPSTARNQVQTDVSILRRLIREAGGPETIRTGRAGYRID